MSVLFQLLLLWRLKLTIKRVKMLSYTAHALSSLLRGSPCFERQASVSWRAISIPLSRAGLFHSKLRPCHGRAVPMVRPIIPYVGRIIVMAASGPPYPVIRVHSGGQLRRERNRAAAVLAGISLAVARGHKQSLGEFEVLTLGVALSQVGFADAGPAWSTRRARQGHLRLSPPCQGATASFLRYSGARQEPSPAPKVSQSFA